MVFTRVGTAFAAVVLFSRLAFGEAATPDPGCLATDAWHTQGSVKTDTVGTRNTNYPEQNATYWITAFELPAGSVLRVRGQYPRARYMALQIYDENRNVIDAINDATIDPEPGQNNPYRTGTVQGTYSVNVVFGRKPARTAPPNTIYTERVARVILMYRIYYSTDSDDLTGGTTTPVLPVISQGGVPMPTCPVRPIIVPEDQLVWGRLDNTDFSGSVPPISSQAPAAISPVWGMSVTGPTTRYYPSQDNSYMFAVVSREFLSPPYINDMVVVRIKAPTFVNTQGGEPPYWSTTTRQVRFWSICSNEPQTTGVVRCAADYQAPLRDGYATVVISDPSNRPSNEVLAQHAATWIPWGALTPGDTVYDENDVPMTNADGVFYQGAVLYRQTMANPGWTQSFTAVGRLPRDQWRDAMGEYWPSAGYCTAGDFVAFGGGCFVPPDARTPVN